VKQFIEAEWGYSIAGKPVISTFNREMHVSKVPLRFDPYLPLVIGYDPGMHSALIFGQQDLYGRLHVLAELILEGYGAERMATTGCSRSLRRRASRRGVIIAPDPAANSRTPTERVDGAAGAARFKYKSTGRRSRRHEPAAAAARRDRALHHAPHRERAGARDRPECRALIRALVSGWRWEQTKKDTEKKAPEKNIHSHPGDAFGYLCRYFHRAR
jgi:hypothetical protein